MTTHDDLAQLIADATSYRDPSGETVFKFAEQRIAGSDVYLNQMPDAIADAILAAFLVVPLSDVQDWEFGVRSTVGGFVEDSHVSRSRTGAAKFVSRRREAQTRLWGHSDAALVRRPILPWTPDPEGSLPLPEDGEKQ